MVDMFFVISFDVIVCMNLCFLLVLVLWFSIKYVKGLLVLCNLMLKLGCLVMVFNLVIL